MESDQNSGSSASMQVSDEAVITITDMNKWYGQFHVLKEINLNVHRGERIVICGPSGSGKSTLIRCINRLEEHQQGSINVDSDFVPLFACFFSTSALSILLRSLLAVLFGFFLSSSSSGSSSSSSRPCCFWVSASFSFDFYFFGGCFFVFSVGFVFFFFTFIIVFTLGLVFFTFSSVSFFFFVSLLVRRFMIHPAGPMRSLCEGVLLVTEQIVWECASGQVECR